MATHTPAQAIQELVNHTAVLTERLVGLQTEVRKGMAATPELGNALTQVVGDTKRMLQAIEHLARLPAFHLDRDGLNAAVAAGVQQGLTGEGGSSLAALIESNSRHLEEARRELVESKRRMDQMLEEVQATKVMSPEGRKDLLKQILPVVGVWSVAMMFVGVLLGAWVGGGSRESASPAQQPPPSVARQQQSAVQQRPPRTPSPQQQQPPQATSAGVVLSRGNQVVLPASTPIYNSANPNSAPVFTAVSGTRLDVLSTDTEGWVQVRFKTGPDQTATGWVTTDALR